MIVLDTNVVSEPMRPEPDVGVVAWLDAQAVDTLYLTTIGLAEVRYGLAALPDGHRRQVLHDRLERDLLPLFTGRVLPFDEPASAEYAAIASRARAAGRPLGGFDALIAGIASTHGFAVATRDVDPFSAAGLAVIDPWSHPRPS